MKRERRGPASPQAHGLTDPPSAGGHNVSGARHDAPRHGCSREERVRAMWESARARCAPHQRADISARMALRRVTRGRSRRRRLPVRPGPHGGIRWCAVDGRCGRNRHQHRFDRRTLRHGDRSGGAAVRRALAGRRRLLRRVRCRGFAKRAGIRLVRSMVLMRNGCSDFTDCMMGTRGLKRLRDTRDRPHHRQHEAGHAPHDRCSHEEAYREPGRRVKWAARSDRRPVRREPAPAETCASWYRH